MTRTRAVLAALSILWVSSEGSAHHSVLALYDPDQLVELEGVIAAVFWNNPHMHLTIETDEGARAERWELETGSVNNLQRMGVPATLFKVGDRIRVAGWLSRHGLNAMRVTNVLLPGGDEVLLERAEGLRWAAQALTPGGARVERSRAAEPLGARGIFRVWTSGREPSDTQAALPLTPSAAAARAAWDPLLDDPALRCIAPGMPAIMDNPFPIAFVEDGADIVLRLEEWDGVRTIHMSAPQDVEAQRATPMGRSVGRWEGNALVVRTTHIDWPYFDDGGTPQSGAVEVLERFTLSKDESRLDYQVTVTDEETFTRPVVRSGFWTWVSGEEVKPYRCTLRDESR